MYKHLVRAWKDSNTDRIPMACSDEEQARSMFNFVLKARSEYDHAELCVRIGGSEYVEVMEVGHREGTVAAGLSAGTVNRALIPVVDQCYADVMAANAAEPYSDEEYDRCDTLLKASLTMLTNGDMPFARALRTAFTDSGENAAGYLRKWTRNELCYQFGEMTQEEYDATLRYAVECKEDGDTWTEAFATREAADQYAASLKANTTVVDREATAAS